MPQRMCGSSPAWRAFFRAWDVVLAPMTLDVAFPHQEGALAERRLTVDDRSAPYEATLLYAIAAIFVRLPSTAFPGGLNAAGLPLGLQAARVPQRSSPRPSPALVAAYPRSRIAATSQSGAERESND
jgi:Asp-tRNA(Asn)/Glu-tRNA(Gln) amidotransferase A subunit family amidase